MSSSLMQLPPKYRSVPSVESLAMSLDRAKTKNRQQGKLAKGAGMVETTAATAVGAVLCGVARGKGWSESSIGIGGGVLAAVGVMTGQSTMVHAANGLLAPLIADMAQKMAGAP